MNFLDNNPSVVSWASEAIFIPYRDPLTGRNTIYVPDFLIVYVSRDGSRHAECIEIKPSTQSTMESAKSLRDRAAVVRNQAKWQAATRWCKQNGLTFRVLTEQQMFHQKSSRR
jgi:hypothetical protein